MAERNKLTLRLTQVNEHKRKGNLIQTWSFEDKCLYFKIKIIMKQLEENRATYNNQLFHNCKENRWLKNMQQVEERYFVFWKRGV